MTTLNEFPGRPKTKVEPEVTFSVDRGSRLMEGRPQNWGQVQIDSSDNFLLQAINLSQRWRLSHDFVPSRKLFLQG